MDSSALALISEIGPQHHLVVNEEGLIQFTDDGDELLIYDDLSASVVRVPSCPESWKHFGIEIQSNDIISPQLSPTTPDTEEREEIEIKEEIIDYDIETTATTIQMVNHNKDPMFTQFNKQTTNKSMIVAWTELQNGKDFKKEKAKQPINTKKVSKTSKTGKTLAAKDNSNAGHIFRENFTVKKFTPEEQLMEFEKRKENRQKYLERLYKCKTCYRGFQLQENYVKHMRCHVTKTRFYCNICRLYMENKSIYHSHVNQHKQKFMCNHCNFESYHRASSVLHARAHAINLPLSYQTYMIQARNSSRARFVCGQCGFSFVNEVGLKLHTRKTHRSEVIILENGPTCTHCDVVFANERAFEMHCRIMHSEYVPKKSDPDETYELPSSPSVGTTIVLQSNDSVIPKRTATLQIDGRSSRLSKRSKSDENPLVPSFLCYLCGATFSTDSRLERHMIDHEDEDGNEESRSGSRIRETMENEDDDKDMSCEVCQKTFGDSLMLYRHVHSHKYAVKLKQQSKRPKCPQCGMTFSSFSNRLRHIKYAHTEVRPSICGICHKAFKSEPELKSHVDHVHLKKPWPKRYRLRRGGRERRDSSPFNFNLNLI